MSISFYLPLWPFAVYAVIGLVLYVPLVLWAYTFISGRRGAFEGARVTKIVRDLLASAVLWPVLVGMLLKDEYKRRTRIGY